MTGSPKAKREYGEMLAALREDDPEAAAVIEAYVQELRDECARLRVDLRGYRE